MIDRLGEQYMKKGYTCKCFIYIYVSFLFKQYQTVFFQQLYLSPGNIYEKKNLSVYQSGFLQQLYLSPGSIYKEKSLSIYQTGFLQQLCLSPGTIYEKTFVSISS